MPVAATTWVLWGRHPLYVDDVAIKLSGGTLPQVRAAQRMRERESDNWLLAIYASGTAPTGLRLQARKAP